MTFSSRAASTRERTVMRRGWGGWIIAAVILFAIVGVAHVPVDTRQGVDYVTSEYTMPLYVKTLEFVQRDVSYGRLARQIVGDRRAPEQVVLALFDWTTRNIRNTPPGLPVVDDHVWHIVIRGYGADDQKADVFTTLATYAGVPAFFSQTEDATQELTLCFAWVGGQWAVFDVENGVVFRNERGGLASAGALARNPALIAAAAAGRTHRGRPYASYLQGFRPPKGPDVLRSELQMSEHRFFYRVRRAVGIKRPWQSGS